MKGWQGEEEARLDGALLFALLQVLLSYMRPGSPSILCSSGVMVAHLMPTLCSCTHRTAVATAEGPIEKTHMERTEARETLRKVRNLARGRTASKRGSRYPTDNVNIHTKSRARRGCCSRRRRAGGGGGPGMDHKTQNQTVSFRTRYEDVFIRLQPVPPSCSCLCAGSETNMSNKHSLRIRLTQTHIIHRLTGEKGCIRQSKPVACLPQRMRSMPCFLPSLTG